MNDSRIFLEIARKDLKAANCLYQHKLYPQAVFYLQQSIEKTYKSFAIQQGMALDELKKKVGHDTLKISSINIRKVLKKAKEREASQRIGAETSLIREGDEKILLKAEEAAQLLENRKLIESIPKAELTNLLPDLVSKRKRIKVFAGNPDDLVIVLEKVLRLIMGKKEYSVFKKENMVMSLSLKHFISEMIDVGFLLSFLSVIIPSTCAENTRYPSKNKNPIKEYSRRNTIVKSFQELTKLCKTVHRKLSSFCADNETEEMNEV